MNLAHIRQAARSALIATSASLLSQFVVGHGPPPLPAGVALLLAAFLVALVFKQWRFAFGSRRPAALLVLSSVLGVGVTSIAISAKTWNHWNEWSIMPSIIATSLTSVIAAHTASTLLMGARARQTHRLLSAALIPISFLLEVSLADAAGFGLKACSDGGPQTWVALLSTSLWALRGWSLGLCWLSLCADPRGFSFSGKTDPVTIVPS